MRSAIRPSEEQRGFDIAGTPGAISCVLLAALSALLIPAWTLGAPKSKKIEVTEAFKIEREETPIIVVRATVNDSGPYAFGLDTGASLTTISSRLAQHLGIKPQVWELGTSTDGRFTFWVGEVDSIAIGSACVRHVPVAIVNLKDLSQATGMQLDGLIGYNFLKSFEVKIDYRRQRISLRRTSESGPKSAR